MHVIVGNNTWIARESTMGRVHTSVNIDKEARTLHNVLSIKLQPLKLTKTIRRISFVIRLSVALKAYLYSNLPSAVLSDLVNTGYSKSLNL